MVNVAVSRELFEAILGSIRKLILLMERSGYPMSDEKGTEVGVEVAFHGTWGEMT